MSTRGQNLVICATCGERRPADEMAGVQRGKWTDWYCHPFARRGVTCYMGQQMSSARRWNRG